MEYHLVTATGGKGVADSSRLNDAVNAKLKEGFELHGSPGLFVEASKGTAIYYQAVTKK